MAKIISRGTNYIPATNFDKVIGKLTKNRHQIFQSTVSNSKLKFDAFLN